MPEGANATTELKLEHADLERLVQRIASAGPGQARVDLVREAASRFLTHARAEERYLLPAFRRYLPTGADEAVGQQRRVAAVHSLVESMERVGEQDDAYNALVGQFVHDVQRHIEHQDTVLLPELLNACPIEDINTIGRQMRFAINDERNSAPTAEL